MAEIRRRFGDDRLESRGRVWFHAVLLCTMGEGVHEVDFTPAEIAPHRVLHVRPGQVHRWSFSREYRATVVFVRDGDHGLATEGWPVGPRLFEVPAAEWTHANGLLRLIQREMTFDREPSRRDRALQAALELLVVALGLDVSQPADGGDLPPVYLELMQQIETDVTWSRSVSDHARRLGYAERTLTRACLAATGRSAKEVIDDRIVLEAQRLLADPDRTVAATATVLGFADPGNFSKFFTRLAGESPTAWRGRNAPPGPPLPGHRRAATRWGRW